MLAGATNVGKACFSKRYDAGMFDEAFLPTIGIDFKMKVIQSPATSKSLKLHIWDINSGQSEFKSH
jgi:GTPase SAR1 family protein